MSSRGVIVSTSTSIAAMSSAAMRWRRTRSSSASSGGCVAAHDGYSFTVIPVSSISQRVPRSAAAVRARHPAARCPWPPGIPAARRAPAALAVNPFLASSAAIDAVARRRARRGAASSSSRCFPSGRTRARRRCRSRARPRPRLEPDHASGGRRRAERANRGSAVPAAAVIVARVHHGARAGIRARSRPRSRRAHAAGRTGPLAGGESRRDERAARMRHRHETHVVVVERVSRDAVGHRRIGRAGRAACAEDVTAARAADEHANDARGRLDGAREDDADRVTHGRGGPPARRLRRSRRRRQNRQCLR